MHWKAVPFAAVDVEPPAVERAVASIAAVPVLGGRIPLAEAITINVGTLADASELVRPTLDRRYLLTWSLDASTGQLATIYGAGRRAFRRRTVDVSRLVRELEALEDRTGPNPADLIADLIATADRYGVPPEDGLDALDRAVMTAELFVVIATKLQAHGYGSLRTYLRGRRQRGGT